MSVYGTLAGIKAIIPTRNDDDVKSSRDDLQQETAAELVEHRRIEKATAEEIRQTAEKLRRARAKRDQIEQTYLRAWGVMRAPTRWTTGERTLSKALRSGLATLADDTRSLLADFAGGLSFRSIARDSGRSLGSVHGRITGAIATLRPKTTFQWPRHWIDALAETADEIPQGRTDCSFPSHRPRARVNTAHIHVRTTTQPGWKHYAPQTSTALAQLIIGSEHADEVAEHTPHAVTDHDAQTRLRYGMPMETEAD